MQCLYVAWTMTECLLRRGVHVQKVPVSRGSTVVRRECFDLTFSVFVCELKSLHQT